MPVRQRGDRWQADLYLPGGKRWRRNFPSEAKAIAAEAKARIDLLGGREPKEMQGTLGSVFNRVWDLEWSKQKAARETHSVASLVVKHFGRETKLGGIDTTAINDFKLALRKAGNSGSTINRKLAALSKLLRFAADEGLCSAPSRIKGEKAGKGRDRFLTHEEEDKLLALLRLWNQGDVLDLVIFLLDTGARLGEALAVRWPDLNGGRVTFFDTKNGSPRSVPLTKRVKAMLADRDKKNGSRYPTVFGTTIPLRRVWERARQTLKLESDPHFVVHILRHTCASRLLQGGFDLEYVGRWLGHRSLKVTQQYAHLAVTSLDQGAAILERRPEARHLGVIEGGKEAQA